MNGNLKTVTTVVDEWLEPLNRRHCNLILNAPPAREGRLAPNVVSRLEEIGKAWKPPGPMAKLSEHVVITTRNLAAGKPIHANSYPDTVGPDEANDGDFGSSWYLDEGKRRAGWKWIWESRRALTLSHWWSPSANGMTTCRAASGAIVFSIGTARNGSL